MPITLFLSPATKFTALSDDSVAQHNILSDTGGILSDRERCWVVYRI
jgi:hypothetical protein